MRPATLFKDFRDLAGDLLRTNIARRSGVYFGATVINALIPFLLLPILARALGPTNYGFIGSFTALASMAAVVVGLCTNGVLAPIYFKTDSRTFANSISACFTVVAATAPVLMLICLLFGPTIGRYTGVGRAWQWTVIGTAAGQFAISIALTTCQVRGEAARFGLLQNANTVLNVALSVLLVVGFGWGWQGRAVAQCVAALAVGAVSFVILQRQYDIQHWPTKENLGAALRFGVPLVPHSLTSVFRATVDRLIIGVVVGYTGAGMYFAAFQIANVLTLVCTAVNQAWTPWLFKRLASGRMEDRREVVRATYAVMALYFAGAAVLMVAGPILLPILVGARFGDAGKLLVVLAPAAAFNGGYLLFTNYIFYAERTGWLPIITSFNALLQAAATYVLVHKFNVWGAAFATLGGGALYMVCIWIAAARLVPMGWFSLLKRTPSA